MKVIGYTRVSTEEQVNSGLSLKAQAEKIKGYASLYDLELTGIIEDAGVSAKNLDRPGLHKVLDLLRTGKVQGVVIAKLDRLSRNVVDINLLIEEFFGEKSSYQSSLLSVSDQIDTRTAGGRLVLNILMSVAQWEREAIGERTRTALQQKKAEGVKLGRPEKKLSGEELEIGQYARELKKSGLSLRQIADRLTDEGYTTARGGKWHATTVKNLLEMEERQ